MSNPLSPKQDEQSKTYFPGQYSYAHRRAELDAARFIDVRNLAHLEYKNDDGTELMTYQQTLEDRDKVKQTILGFELARGITVADGTGVAGDISQPISPLGAQPMTLPFQPPFQPPQNGSPQPQQPQQYQQPNQQPPPQMMAPPLPMATPPIASPVQAVQAAQLAPGAPIEQPPAPIGRKRRGAAGTNVAPPPVGPPPTALPPTPPQLQGGFMLPPGMAPPQPQQAPQFAPPSFVQPQAYAPPQFGQPPAPVGTPFQAAGFTPPSPAAQPSPSMDLGPIQQRLDMLGQMTENLVNIVTAQKAQIDQLANQLMDSKRATLEALTCLQHMYLTHPQLAPGAQGKNTLPEFRQFLSQFVGP